jgi:hypothetical protein
MGAVTVVVHLALKAAPVVPAAGRDLILRPEVLVTRLVNLLLEVMVHLL